MLHAGLQAGRDVVVLVPGFTGSKEDFIAVLPRLNDAGLGVVAFDQLGQFESSASSREEDYALSLLASDVGEVARQAMERCIGRERPALHVVGHSFGGLVVQEAVAEGHVSASTLALLCTGPGALPQSRWRQLPELVAALEEHDLATIWRVMQDMEEQQETELPPPQVREFVERRWHANSPVHLAAVARLLMEQPPLTDRVRERVRAESIAVTVVWGERDDAWPVEDQVAMGGALDATLLELPGLGHSPNAEDPGATADALLVAVRGGSRRR